MKINVHHSNKKIGRSLRSLVPKKKSNVAKKQLKSPIRGACPASKSINSPQHDTSLDTDEQIQEQIDKPIVEASHEETISFKC